MMRKIIAMVCALVMVVSLAGCGASKEESFKPITIRFANQHPTDSIASEADRRICERIAEETEGRVTVQLYTDSSLGDYSSTVQELMMEIGRAHV